eukprot:m.190065 g.190065  ORF g.190065 m.190065 type:complete len:68 (+) comp25681_c0_seq11:19-222(+)
MKLHTAFHGSCSFAAFAFVGFIVSVIWIYIVANEIVNLLQTLGRLVGIGDAILGLTVLAWGNSIGGK